MKQSHIFLFWLPLFGSWLLMSLEGAIITSLVSRLPEPVIMLAAFGVVLGLSVLIQSPCINLLATSTAKSGDYEGYLLVRRFTIHMLTVLTVLTVLIAYTPLFDIVVRQGMGVPTDIAEHVRVGMRINILWSASVGWRRFQQGVLIRFNRPKTVVAGTVIRLITGTFAAIMLIQFTNASGIVVGAWTLQIAVFSEALYATLATRPLFREELTPENVSDGPPLTYQDLFFFHLPLAGTAMLALLVQPLAVFSLARLPNATLSLAAWPILFQLLFIYRAPAMATPEVIIALNKNDETKQALLRFVGLLSVATLLATILFVFTPLQSLYLNVLQDLPQPVSRLVLVGLWSILLFPILNVIVFG
ncbi:MAG: hypothetical protein AAF485_21880, partial [Chloroflexota bacterium]